MQIAVALCDRYSGPTMGSRALVIIHDNVKGERIAVVAFWKINAGYFLGPWLFRGAEKLRSESHAVSGPVACISYQALVFSEGPTGFDHAGYTCCAAVAEL